VKEVLSTNQNHEKGDDILLKSRVLDLYNEKYKNPYELAQAMKISVCQIYGVHQGRYNINEEFIIGAIRAFPEYNIGDLFYFTT